MNATPQIDNVDCKFEIIEYDVWGNEEGGFEVNNSFHTGHYVWLKENMTDIQIVQALIDIGYYSAESIDNAINVDIDGDFEYSLYIEYKGRPENELRRVTD